MSETEAQKDLATEQPTAEDLKGVKRAAEVSPLSLVSSIFDLFPTRKMPVAISAPAIESIFRRCPALSLKCRPSVDISLIFTFV